jgi:hypothetical protein
MNYSQISKEKLNSLIESSESYIITVLDDSIKSNFIKGGFDNIKDNINIPLYYAYDSFYKGSIIIGLSGSRMILNNFNLNDIFEIIKEYCN